jgi:hypothetical protein
VLGSAVAVADTPTTTTPPPTTEPELVAEPMTATPQSGRPGHAVTLTMMAPCDDVPKFHTTVLTIIEMESYPGYELEVSAKVDSDAKPGTYPVVATCTRHGWDRAFATSFTVLKNPAPAGHQVKTPAAPQVKQVPKGAPQTGGGGTASQS